MCATCLNEPADWGQCQSYRATPPSDQLNRVRGADVNVRDVTYVTYRTRNERFVDLARRRFLALLRRCSLLLLVLLHFGCTSARAHPLPNRICLYSLAYLDLFATFL
jgi:hypothetical protein